VAGRIITCTPTECGARTTPVELVADSGFLSSTCTHSPLVAQPPGHTRTWVISGEGDASEPLRDGLAVARTLSLDLAALSLLSVHTHPCVLRGCRGRAPSPRCPASEHAVSRATQHAAVGMYVVALHRSRASPLVREATRRRGATS
jgi:hypothetical protein